MSHVDSSFKGWTTGAPEEMWDRASVMMDRQISTTRLNKPKNMLKCSFLNLTSALEFLSQYKIRDGNGENKE